MMIRRPRKHWEEYLDYIRSLPCCICHNNIQTEACHVRYGSDKHGKPPTPFGRKPDDTWTVPMCNLHHREQHTHNERDWWYLRKIDPLRICLALFRAYLFDDREAAETIIFSPPED